MRNRIFILLFLIVTSSSAQDLRDITDLDSVIMMPDLKISDTKFGVKTSTFQEELIFCPIFPTKKSDTIVFYKIDSAFRISTIPVHIQNYVSLKSAVNIDAITHNSEFLAFLLNNQLYIYQAISSEMRLKSIIDLGRSYSYIKLLDKNRIALGECYDHKGRKGLSNTSLLIYDLNKGSFDQQLTPPFENIEFTHSFPNHWIDAYKNKIAFAQTTSYEIDIYDAKLNLTKVIKRPELSWDKFVPDHFHSSDIFDALDYYENKGTSRVEGTWFINDTTLLVSYKSKNGNAKNYIHYFDKYILKGNDWVLYEKDLIDVKFPIPVNDTITKGTCFVWTWNHNTTFGKNKIFVLRNYADIQYVDRRWVDIFNDEQKFYEEKNPIFSVFIYSIH